MHLRAVILLLASGVLMGCGGTPMDGRASVACGAGTEQVGDVCVALDARPPILCGPGTVQVGNVCVPIDAGVDARPDAGIDAGIDASPPDAFTCPVGPSEATSFAINPAHDNLQPEDAVASPLAPAWTASFTGHIGYPLIAGGHVIVAAAETQPNVRAFDLETGTIAWGPIVLGTELKVAYDACRVFALDVNGNVTALNATTGAQLWTTSLMRNRAYFFAAPPVGSGGLLYVNAEGIGGTTFALDEQNGSVLWSSGTFDGSEGAVAVVFPYVFDAEACDVLYTFDALSGNQVWLHSGGCTGGGGAAPAFHQDKIWVRDWSAGNAIITTSGGDYGSFAASANPAFNGQTVFYTASNATSSALGAVDIQSGRLLWSFSGDGQLCTAPVIAGRGGQVFVGSQSGNVYELDEATGLQISVHAAGSPITCADPLPAGRGEKDAMALGSGHLVVPAGNLLLVY